MLQGLHLTGKPGGTVFVFAPVHGADAYGIPCCTELLCALIPDDAGKGAIQGVPDPVIISIFLVEVAWFG